jgi:hypothetical protein
MSDKKWSDGVATLVADALVDAGILKIEELEKALEIISEEINVRLCLNDYPKMDAEQDK